MPAPGLGLVAGDLLLATAEDELSNQWRSCLDDRSLDDTSLWQFESVSNQVISALARVLGKAGDRLEADLVLVDVGPNLGALNRAALLAADAVVVPLAPDLHSLQGLHAMGPALRSWREGWEQRRQLSPVDSDTPKGRMRPVGYIVMHHWIRLDRPVYAYPPWVRRIPTVFSQAVVGGRTQRTQGIADDVNCLGALMHRSLMPLAQEVRKPMFHLKPADGAIGGHAAAVRACYADFRALAKTVAARTGVTI